MTGTAVSPSHRATEQVVRWEAQYGSDQAQRLLGAEHAREEIKRRLRPPNTSSTYAKSWKVWERFCEQGGFPVQEPTGGALVMFVMWMIDRGRIDGSGMAPSSVDTILSGTVVEHRDRGHEVSPQDVSDARVILNSLAAELARNGEFRGRGQAVAADIPGLMRIAESVPDSLSGRRDLAMVLDGLHFASRASEVSGLWRPSVELHSEGLLVRVATGKTVLSVRTVAIPYAKEKKICPVLSWLHWREDLGARPATDKAFHSIDRWGNVGSGMTPAGVSAAISRIAEYSGVPVKWTGHSLRAGLATISRRNGATVEAIARQGGWSPTSRQLYKYIRLVDQWKETASDFVA